MSRTIHKIKLITWIFIFFSIFEPARSAPVVNVNKKEINHDEKKINNPSVDNQKINDLENQSQLPELDLEKYRNDLEEIKKLQREKIKLELEKNNEELSNSLGVKKKTQPLDGIYVIEIIYMKNKSKARLYVPGKGIIVVKKGDYLNDNVKVIGINQKFVSASYKINNVKHQSKLSFYYGI